MTAEEAKKHLNLVHSCAGRFRNRGIEYDDLFSIGCIGLLKAAKGFDESKGFRFSTYAVPFIFGEIKHAFRDNNSVKVSRSTRELSARINEARHKLSSEQGAEPTAYQIAGYLGVSAELVSEALNSSNPVLHITDDENNLLIENFPSDENVEEEVLSRLDLKNALSMLSEEDRHLVILRFYKNLSQSQTAKILGMYQVQVSRREKKILSSLKDLLRN